jgi:hypothetical protein
MIVLLAVMMVSMSTAWHIGHQSHHVSKNTPFSHASTRSSLYMQASSNIVSTDLSSAPTTFIECARRAAKAARLAYNDGEKLMEVEFPPLPLQYLEDSSSSARDISDANTRWALEFALGFADLGKVSIIYPDQPELDDAIKYVDSPNLENPYENVTLATIRADSVKNAKSLDQILLSVFGATVGGTVVGIPDTKVYVAIISSTQELPDLKKLHDLDPSIPIIFFNLKLDVLVCSQNYDWEDMLHDALTPCRM